MPGKARVAVDSAGGTQQGLQAPTVFVNFQPVVVLGDKVAPHGKSPHSSPVMVEASPDVFAHGIPVCREGDKASCGHPSTGSPNVFAN